MFVNMQSICVNINRHYVIGIISLAVQGTGLWHGGLKAVHLVAGTTNSSNEKGHPVLKKECLKQNTIVNSWSQSMLVLTCEIQNTDPDLKNIQNCDWDLSWAFT